MAAEGPVQCSCQSGWKLDVDLRSCVGEIFNVFRGTTNNNVTMIGRRTFALNTRFPSIMRKLEALQIVLNV